MFDLATYPAISLKFIEIQFDDNYEHHESRQEIHRSKKKKNRDELLSVFLRTPRFHQLVSQRIIKERNDSILIHYSRSLDLSLERS